LVTLLLERGADPTIAMDRGSTPLGRATDHLEIVRLLLGHPSVKAFINFRDDHGGTALYWACHGGREGVVRALLASGADPTITRTDGTTPMAVAKQSVPVWLKGVTAEGRRECVAALKVGFL
jgi:ankyrin repeat protein